MNLQTIKQISRGLLKYKGFTFINLLGLSIGMAATIIIFLVSGYENSFDKIHSDSGNIFRVVTKSKLGNEDHFSSNTPYPTAKLLRFEYPGILASQIHFFREANVRIGKDDAFEEKNVAFVDSLFFRILDFSGIKNFFVRGNPATALDGPNKVLLTESTAKKYFGSVNPMGQLIRLNNVADMEVTGIIKDIPATTHLPLNMIVSYASLTKEFISGMDPNSFTFTSNGYTYIRLKNPGELPVAELALSSVVKKNSDPERAKRESWSFQPLSEVHFDRAYEISNAGSTVSHKYITMLLLLAGFIIMIACVNYVNLSTSLAFSKSKEVGIRKTIGASRKQLFFHYMLETVFVTTVAALLALAIASSLVPVVNRMLGKSVSFSQLLDWKYITGLMLGIMLISFISGIYPAVILAGFSPITALKSKFILPGKRSALLRQSLVVFQFTTSIALIICTIVIARQMDYVQKKELGFNKQSVIEVGLPVSDSTRREGLKALIQTNPSIESFSFCLGAPVSDNGFGTSLEAPELPKNTDYNVQLIPCDKNYLETYDLKLLAGRWFLDGAEKNMGSELVVNQKLIKMLGYSDPEKAIGKKIKIGVNDYNPTIIGVTNDFHTASFQESIGPVGLMPFPYFYYAAAVKIKPGKIKDALASIELSYKKIYPESPYQMKFIDEVLADRYKKEKTDYDLFKTFSLVSIFICCIGLWGLIAFVVARKTKEMGIRKVLGSSVTGIVYLLSKDFMKLITIALLIASPLAWYFMNKWLQDFAYRISISWWIFIMAGLSALIIAMITVSFQTIRAALSNPVKNLRTE